MAERAEAKKKITLKTVDGGVFDVNPAIAKDLETVQSFIDADSAAADDAVLIPLPNVYSRELSKILDHCNSHHRFRSAGAGGDAAAAKRYDEEFVKALSQEELKELILAANYLNVKELLDFLNQSVANLIENKSVEFVRKFFGVVNDYTPEEEARLREENAWAFEGVDDDWIIDSSSIRFSSFDYRRLIERNSRIKVYI